MGTKRRGDLGVHARHLCGSARGHEEKPGTLTGTVPSPPLKRNLRCHQMDRRSENVKQVCRRFRRDLRRGCRASGGARPESMAGTRWDPRNTGHCLMDRHGYCGKSLRVGLPVSGKLKSSFALQLFQNPGPEQPLTWADATQLPLSWPGGAPAGGALSAYFFALYSAIDFFKSRYSSQENRQSLSSAARCSSALARLPCIR
jgi:hypothetical protein